MSWCKKLLFIKYRAFAKLRLLFVLLLLSVAIIIGLFLLRARQPIHNVPLLRRALSSKMPSHRFP
jgi:hypothetical protein